MWSRRSNRHARPIRTISCCCAAGMAIRSSCRCRSSRKPTDEEIAAIVGVSHETFVRRKREPEIAEMILQARSKGKASLRRIQYQLAENGNAAMAIFLGKNWLGQRDKIEDQPVDLGPLPW